MAGSGAGAGAGAWVRRSGTCRTCAFLAVAALCGQLLLALHFLSVTPPADPGRPQPPGPRAQVESADAGVSALRAPDVRDAPSDDEDSRPRHRLFDVDFEPACRVRAKEAVSAVHRAKTQTCKRLIVDVSCALQRGNFYPESLVDLCPRNAPVSRQPLGCFRDQKNFRLLSGYYANYKETNEPDLCVDMCLQGGFPYAGVQYSTECFCGENRPPSASKLADTSCNMKCPGNPRHLCGGYFTMNVYQTGITKFVPQTAALTTEETTTPVRIVFLLTLNGRALRQVRRLINVLYDVKHYFFIHVDARQDYLYRELLPLEKEFTNIKLARKRYATIWGGASLLEMLLNSMKDLLTFDWKWNFVINLSESDFPVKSIEKLEEFLSANKGKNFVKSHGREVQRFIQKQGLDKTFVECDAHMWRIGDRRLPWGLQIDGGSDWVALDRNFVKYVTSSHDTLISGLLVVFRHTLLPAESFFHTVLRNSKFCETYIDNNLHVTNWKRKLGCKCQYKHVVDWCGCSPNDFRLEDWPRLQATEQRQLFFARKFEPVINQAIILRVEQWIQGIDQDHLINIDAYWQSIYNHIDKSPPPDDSLVTITTSITRLNAKVMSDEGCIIKPGIVKEVTSYHFADTFKGSLILHEAQINGFNKVVVETWFKYQHYVQINRSSKYFERLKVFSVSTDYDQKEQVFRNLVRAIGPFSEPSLMYHFVPSAEETSVSSNVTFLWFDSVGNVADVSDAFIDEGNIINFIKPSLKVPLLPGVWTVKMYDGKSLVAITKFLVSPLQFMSGSETSPQETVVLHGGSVAAYKDFTSPLKTFKNMIFSEDEIKAAKLKSEANAKRFGLDLKEWIDSLTVQFYSVLGTCVTSNDHKTYKCGKINLMPCHTTTWSSLAPDPKSFEGKMKKNIVKKDYFNYDI